VIAKYLYEFLNPGFPAFSAGIEVGDQVNDRAAVMLQWWGLDASGHIPRKIDREICDQVDAIFVMGPEYLLRLIRTHGMDLVDKVYLFADPFTLPESFQNGAYHVYDPSFDDRPVEALVQDYDWFPSRVCQIHQALISGRRDLVPANRYLRILENDLPFTAESAE
jgi:protein-tyrosine-phosphatase